MVAWSAGVIAMATHHGSVLARGILGSVTDRVLHSTTIPMLVVHPREGVAADPSGIGSVLVPLDGSGLGECAVPVAQAIGCVRRQLHPAQSLTPVILGAGQAVECLEGPAGEGAQALRRGPAPDAS